MNEIATDFLTRCFSTGDTIALLLRNENTAKTQQRVVLLETALTAPFGRWLARENHCGANIYVAANPLRSGSRRRTKESVASIRHLYLDIDEDGDARLAALRAVDNIPQPYAILSTSPGKYQTLWRVEGFDLVEQEVTLKRLAIAFGGDPACTDCNRVLRIPGFLNQKYSPAHRVAVEYGSDRPSTPSEFHLLSEAERVALPVQGITRQRTCRKDTRSEQDWAWTCFQLEQGIDAGKLTHQLASRRSDKPNPIYYAQRTVDIASARLSFLENAPIDDVITMLENRRRFELSASLCSARAREIAATAQRMTARR